MRPFEVAIAIVVISWVVVDVSTTRAQTEPLAAEPSILDAGVAFEPERPELETDRDAFTPATSTVGRRLTVLEASHTFIDNKLVPETNSFPELLLRHGITERIELRLGWNYEVGGEGDIVSGDDGSEIFIGTKLKHESGILYGVKASLSDQEGWMPRSIVSIDGNTPTSGAATATDLTVGYALGWEFANRWRLDSSLRYLTVHTERESFNEWAPSTVLRIPLNDRWNVHAEYFGIYSQGPEREFGSAFLSPGTHYLLTENLEIGVRVGWGVTQDAPRFFSNFGIGWRF